jgi:carbonic anhydrase/acetyltransferase-like protein (isoleucine patch superfamily)
MKSDFSRSFESIDEITNVHSREFLRISGMGALLQEGVVVSEESFVAAGAVVPKDTVIESGELWAGVPARKLRDLTPEERQKLHFQANAVS